MAYNKPDIIELYETFRKYEEHEDHLVNYRMTWMTAVNAGLFAAIGFLMSQVCSSEKQCVAAPLLKDDNYLYVAVNGIITFGILVCLTSYVSILAAKSAVTGVRRVFRLNFSNIKKSIEEKPEQVPNWREIASSAQAFRRQVEFQEAGTAANSGVNLIRFKTYIPPSINFRSQLTGKTNHDNRPNATVYAYAVECDGGENVYLPYLAGGGLPRTIKHGFSAAAIHPLIFLLGWIGVKLLLDFKYGFANTVANQTFYAILVVVVAVALYKSFSSEE